MLFDATPVRRPRSARKSLKTVLTLLSSIVNTDAINPTADAPRRFFNHLGQQGRLGKSQPSFLSAKITQTDLEQRSIAHTVGEEAEEPVTGAEWNAWYRDEIRRTETVQARAQRAQERWEEEQALRNAANRRVGRWGR